jgi:acyl-CoA synthetase (AMP-forming)/AMP-acid ligase II
MLSTMAQSPLTVEQILRYAVDEHGDRSVTTATREGCRKITYSELCNQASRLANGLRRMGITGDERVATFMWNNQEHVIPFSLHTAEVAQRPLPEALRLVSPQFAGHHVSGIGAVPAFCDAQA